MYLVRKTDLSQAAAQRSLKADGWLQAKDSKPIIMIERSVDIWLHACDERICKAVFVEEDEV